MIRSSLFLFMVFLAGCSNKPGDVRIPLEGSQGKTIASFYAGMIKEDGAPELVQEDSLGVSIRIAPLRAVSPKLGLVLDEIRSGKEQLDRSEWGRFIQAIVEETNPLPKTLQELFPEGPPPFFPHHYFQLKVYGAMTSLLREVYVPVSALEEGLLKYWDRGGVLQYPAGTVIAAYHKTNEGSTLEITVKKRRRDGFWDFGIYDSAGWRVHQTSSPPTSYSAPVQCMGCHLGSMPYEPEDSFITGEVGKTEGEFLVLRSGMRNENVVMLLDEHNRRSDRVLGVYGTVYLTSILNLPPSQRSERQQTIASLFLPHIQ